MNPNDLSLSDFVYSELAFSCIHEGVATTEGGDR
jgi:hypothetical protein